MSDRLVDTLEHGGGIKTSADSKQIYDHYGDRELKDNYGGAGELVMMNGRAQFLSYKDRRDRHLEYLCTAIDDIIAEKGQCSVLEVGCGNLMNAFETLQKYGDRVDFHGIDISYDRIANGLHYFGRFLQPDHFSEKSITQDTGFPSGAFDIVFSMHCLEQIAYDAKTAMQEMYRICNRKIVMIEPVYENGSFLQRTYLMLSDHTRVLYKSIAELGLSVEVNEPCPVQTNLENQSSLLVITKQVKPA